MDVSPSSFALHMLSAMGSDASSSSVSGPPSQSSASSSSPAPPSLPAAPPSPAPPPAAASAYPASAFASFPGSRGLSPALIASGALQQHQEAAAGAALSLPLHLLRLQQQSALAKQQGLAAQAVGGSLSAGGQAGGAISAFLQANRLPQQALAALQQRQLSAQQRSGDTASSGKVHWVQCDRCDKWRVAPFEINATTWVCAQNTWDPRFASCSVPEETNVEPDSPSSSDAADAAPSGAQLPTLASGAGGGASSGVAAAGPAGKGKGAGGGGAAAKSRAARPKKKATPDAPAVAAAAAGAGGPSAGGAVGGAKKGRGGAGAGAARREAGAAGPALPSGAAGPAAGGGVVNISSAASALMAAGLPFSALQHAQTQQLLQHPLLAGSQGPGRGGGGAAGLFASKRSPSLAPAASGARAGDAQLLQQHLLQQHQQLQGQRLLQQIRSYAHGLPGEQAAAAQLVFEHWVQCDACNKWRRAPVEITSEKWFCRMNTWAPHFASCEVPEEHDPEAHDIDPANPLPPAVLARGGARATPKGAAGGREEEDKRGGAQKRQRSAAAGAGRGASSRAKARIDKGGGAAPARARATGPGARGDADAALSSRESLLEGGEEDLKTERGDSGGAEGALASFGGACLPAAATLASLAGFPQGSLGLTASGGLQLPGLPAGAAAAASQFGAVAAALGGVEQASRLLSGVARVSAPQTGVAASPVSAVPSLSSLLPAASALPAAGEETAWPQCASCGKAKRPAEDAGAEERCCCCPNAWEAAPQDAWEAPAEATPEAGVAAAPAQGDGARDSATDSQFANGNPQALPLAAGESELGNAQTTLRGQAGGATSGGSPGLPLLAAGAPLAGSGSQLNPQQRLQILLQMQSAAGALAPAPQANASEGVPLEAETPADAGDGGEKGKAEATQEEEEEKEEGTEDTGNGGRKHEDDEEGGGAGASHGGTGAAGGGTSGGSGRAPSGRQGDGDCGKRGGGSEKGEGGETEGESSPDIDAAEEQRQSSRSHSAVPSVSLSSPSVDVSASSSARPLSGALSASLSSSLTAPSLSSSSPSVAASMASHAVSPLPSVPSLPAATVAPARAVEGALAAMLSSRLGCAGVDGETGSLSPFSSSFLCLLQKELQNAGRGAPSLACPLQVLN